MNLLDKSINRLSMSLLHRLMRNDTRGELAPFFQSHIDKHLAQNDDNMDTNGEAFFLNCLSQLFPNGTVLDVGANIGEWAKIALDLTPGWKVHCFEPNPAIFARLQAAGLPADRATLHNFGLSDTVGEAELFNYAADHALNSLYLRKSLVNMNAVEKSETLKIKLETLDHINASLSLQNIALLKIDVEGHETQVMRGAAQILHEQKIQTIQFEYGGTWIDSHTFLSDAWEILSEHGYRIAKITPQGLKIYPHYDPKLETFQYCNYAALAPQVDWPAKWTVA